MSIEIMARVWKYADSSLGELLVLLAIADHANDNGYAWPSVEGLARKSRLSERQTHYILKQLKEKGYLEIQLNAGPKGCNLYRVTVRGGAVSAPPGAVCNNGGCSLPHKGVQSTAPESSYKPSVQSSGGRKPSVWDLKDILRAKEDLALEIHNHHCSHAAMSVHWDNPTKQAEYLRLKREIKEVKRQIANYERT